MLGQAYPVRLVCRVLDYAPSSYYYQAQPRDEAALKVALTALAEPWPTHGSRWLTHYLRRAGWIINRKRVVRLMAELGLTAHPSVSRPRTTDSQHGYRRYPNLVKDLPIVQPDQVWVADITYIPLERGFVYLALVMDVFTRLIRGWQLSRHLDGALTLAALLNQGVNTLRQRLREFDQPADRKAGRGRTALDPTTCCAPVVRWVTGGWADKRVALARDATNLGDRFHVLAAAIVYRGCSIPVAGRSCRRASRIRGTRTGCGCSTASRSRWARVGRSRC